MSKKGKERYMGFWSNSEAITTSFGNTLKNIFLITWNRVFYTMKDKESRRKRYLRIQPVKVSQIASLGRVNSKAGTIVTVSSLDKYAAGSETRVWYKSTNYYHSIEHKKIQAGHISISANQKWVVWTWSIAILRSLLIG